MQYRVHNRFMAHLSGKPIFANLRIQPEANMRYRIQIQ
jgi:hypothetical protein